jgi:rhamnogalacturonyl hydrolase YesR
MPAHYHTAQVIDAPMLPLPADKRLTRGWRAFAIPPGGSALLKWEPLLPFTDPARLRVAVALDEREEKQLEAALAQSGRIIGTFDIRYAHIFQPFEIGLSPDDALAAGHEGVRLRLIEGQEPLWLLHDPDNQQISPPLMPHLLRADPNESARSALVERLASPATLQFFGWQEGCILDGILDLGRVGILPQERATSAINSHFAYFFDEAGQLDYEDDHSRPRREIYGIECTLPFAVLAQTQPQHPALQTAVAYWTGESFSGAIQDEDILTAEGSYTVAYPLAVLARILNEPALAELAVAQLRIRCNTLFTRAGIDLRYQRGGARTFRNWCRAVAWYTLGLTRTLTALPQPPADLVDALAQAAAWIVPYQRADGLWSAFVDEPHVRPDTSGSAGIAAALALGLRQGWLPAAYRDHAQRALDGLWPHVTPDGFLSGVAQVNKTGEWLQRGNYRVIAQFGMGLMAQLIAALERP